MRASESASPKLEKPRAKIGYRAEHGEQMQNKIPEKLLRTTVKRFPAV